MPQTPLQRYNDEVKALLRPPNPGTRSLLEIIRRTLKQFNLSESVSEVEVFVEAYLRGFDHCCNSDKEPIRNVKAWLRVVAFNIIREKRRKQSREKKAPYDTITENELGRQEITARAEDLEFIDQDMKAVMVAFAQLSPYKQLLLKLKIMDGLPWRKVQETLVAMGEELYNVDTLRQQGRRALEALRQEYHKIRPNTSI